MTRWLKKINNCNFLLLNTLLSSNRAMAARSATASSTAPSRAPLHAGSPSGQIDPMVYHRTITSLNVTFKDETETAMADESAHHTIKARHVKFDWSNTPVQWIPGDPSSTHIINVLNLL